MGRYTGVYYRSRDRIWVAQVYDKGKTTWLGSYTDELTAMKVRDFAIRELGLNKKRYFLDKELGPEIEKLYRETVSRKQGQPISKTKRKHTKKRAKTSGLRKKMLESQRLAENEIN